MEADNIYILCIDTSTSVCSVSLGQNEHLVTFRESNENFDHSKMITVFINEILNETNIKKSDLNAIALSSGPGSYTGLRIGASVAKAMCYGLDIPFISIDSCHILANSHPDEADVSFGIIDARRQDVYIAMKEIQKNTFSVSEFKTISLEYFKDFENLKINLSGDGANKTSEILTQNKIPHSVHLKNSTSKIMIQLAIESYRQKMFSELEKFSIKYIKSVNITKK